MRVGDEEGYMTEREGRGIGRRELGRVVQVRLILAERECCTLCT